MKGGFSMGIFSKKEKEDKPVAENAWINNAIYEPKVANNDHFPMNDLYQELSDSKKGEIGLFKKNSDKYKEVSDSLKLVLKQMEAPLGNNIPALEKTSHDLETAYDVLKKACNNYLRRYAFSSTGKARQDIVQKIKEQAVADQLALKTYLGEYQILPDSERASKVWEAMEISRRKRFYMNDSDSAFDHVGGEASRLTVLKEGDLKDTTTSGFFKDTEIFTYRTDSYEHIFDIMDHARKICPISNDLYKKAVKTIKQAIQKNKDLIKKRAAYNQTEKNATVGQLSESLTSMNELLTIPEFSSYVKTVCALANSYDTTSDHMQGRGYLNLNLQNGKSVNLTNRNVATSHMADLLGAGDVIARSETVEMIEPGKSTPRVGNLMQKAEGKAAAYYSSSSYSGDVSKKITGNLQRQLVNLQVLDYITGQIDRHTNNYFIQEDKDTGMLTGVTGIDNDFSFGNNEQLGSTIGENGISIFHDDGTFLIPHMDAAMADRILAVNKDQLLFLLGDLLEPAAIDGAWKRLSQVQTAIKKKKEEEGNHFFLQNHEWNAETLEDLNNTTHRDVYGNKNNIGNYVARLLQKPANPK